jgi:hypothetical protein
MTGHVRPQDIPPGKSGGKMSGMQQVLYIKGMDMKYPAAKYRAEILMHSDRNKIIFFRTFRFRTFRIRTLHVHHTLYKVKKDALKGDLPMF